MSKTKSKTIQQCTKTLARCMVLTRRYITDFASEETKHQHSKDLVRASVVLAVAAMDAYFTNKFTEVLIPYLKKKGPTPDLVDFLSKAGLNTKEALTMLTMDRPYRRVHTIVQRHLEKYTSQRFHVIDDLFKIYGLKDLSKHVQAKAGRKRLRRSIEILVERRHQIVHNGDYNKHGRLRDINETSTISRIGDVLTFVKHAEDIINNLSL